MLSSNKPVIGIVTIIFSLLHLAANSQTNNTDSLYNKEWISRSNDYTKKLLDIDKKYSPEFGSLQGFAAYDTLISVPTFNNLMAERNERLSAMA
jgi:hypothetical protein